MIVNDEIWPDAHQLYDSPLAVTLPDGMAGDHIAELDVAIICKPPAESWLETFEVVMEEILRTRLHFDKQTAIRLRYGSHVVGPQTPGSVEIQFWLRPEFQKPLIISQRGINAGLGQ